MQVKSFHIEDSKVNKGMKILIAVTETGEKYVVGGDAQYATALTQYEETWDAIGQEEMKKLQGFK